MNSHFALTLGCLNPALNNPALFVFLSPIDLVSGTQTVINTQVREGAGDTLILSDGVGKIEYSGVFLDRKIWQAFLGD